MLYTMENVDTGARWVMARDKDGEMTIIYEFAEGDAFSPILGGDDFVIVPCIGASFVMERHTDGTYARVDPS